MAAFGALANDPAFALEAAMADGEAVLFTNRRVLHGRRAIGGGVAQGPRWLRGLHLDLDDVESRRRVLREAAGVVLCDARCASAGAPMAVCLLRVL
jgi:hypothetical protein